MCLRGVQASCIGVSIYICVHTPFLRVVCSDSQCKHIPGEMVCIFCGCIYRVILSYNM